MLESVFSTPSPASVLITIEAAERRETEALFSSLDGRFSAFVFPVSDWNGALSPWAAEAVFGDEGFSGGGRETLRQLEADVAALPPELRGLPLYLGGYSLAGLFALWALHESSLFSGCAAVSGSFWFPGLVEYAQSAPLSPEAKIYLSLGKKESKSRNRQMRTVSTALNALYEYYSSRCLCTLEWNEGNHFTEPSERLRKGFQWLLRGPDS